jgi:hypothetical protein
VGEGDPFQDGDLLPAIGGDRVGPGVSENLFGKPRRFAHVSIEKECMDPFRRELGNRRLVFLRVQVPGAGKGAGRFVQCTAGTLAPSRRDEELARAERFAGRFEMASDLHICFAAGFFEMAGDPPVQCLAPLRGNRLQNLARLVRPRDAEAMRSRLSVMKNSLANPAREKTGQCFFAVFVQRGKNARIEFGTGDGGQLQE